MDVLFLSCAYSDSQKDRFRTKSKRGYQFAAQNLQEALIDGFFENDVNLRILSIPSLSTFPLGCKLMRIKDESFVFNNRLCGSSLGYFNIPFFRYGKKIRGKALKIVDSWYKEAGNEKVIFVYALLSFQMTLAVEIKRRYPDVKLCVIVPDLPQFMGYNLFMKKLGFQKKYFNLVNSLLPYFDGYVVLAKPMAQALGIENKPYVVVEGIFCGGDDELVACKSGKKIILYTGNIGERYGIRSLLEAFERIKDPNYKLQIRGTGDNTEVIDFQAKDLRIEYIGPLSKRELTQLQKNATLLVNPVSPEQEFTRYFFPSKTMDYLASGTPTVMFKLDCLPAEYYDYLYFFDNTSAESMAETMKKICSKSRSELNDFGANAANFIISQKTPQKQVKIIIELFKQLF